MGHHQEAGKPPQGRGDDGLGRMIMSLSGASQWSRKRLGVSTPTRDGAREFSSIPDSVQRDSAGQGRGWRGADLARGDELQLQPQRL